MDVDTIRENANLAKGCILNMNNRGRFDDQVLIAINDDFVHYYDCLTQAIDYFLSSDECDWGELPTGIWLRYEVLDVIRMTEICLNRQCD